MTGDVRTAGDGGGSLPRRRALIERLAPNLEVQKDWRGPTHLAESIRRVTDFLTRHTP